MDSPRPPGITTIDTGVLLSIARLTTLAIPGVSRMGEVPGSVRGFFHQRGHDQGVRVEVKNSKVDVDVYVIFHKDTDIRATSRQIQHEIARAIFDMVGMEIGQINIHIDDIDYPPEAESPAEK